MPSANIIADWIEVRPHPTVVRLDDLESSSSDWISASYYITDDVEKHVHALKAALARDCGCGIFLIGHYGSGKSHFLAYLIQRFQAGGLDGLRPRVHYLSLINFSAENTLESIVMQQLGLAISHDRREAFSELDQDPDYGSILILDEVSEFLRSKADSASFNEDIRFLQFLGEWAQDRRFWVIAALQEQIEHTGDFDQDLYRKIKDRYPLRFLLSPVHVRDLVAQTLMNRKPGYDEAVTELAQDMVAGLPVNMVDAQELIRLYPLHPLTLDFLEEVRDCFSQARGIVEFVVTRMNGDARRGIEPFLQQPWGALITADCIVDHFRDLFEIQPEFVTLATQYLAWYERHLGHLFPQERQQSLAARLVKLLMLVHISPVREGLSAREALYWLLFRATRLNENKNLELMRRMLDRLVDDGRFVQRKGDLYSINLRQDGAQELAQRMDRAQRDLAGKSVAVFDLLTDLLKDKPFNPFSIARHEWQPRSCRWHYHDRPYRLRLAGAEAVERDDSIHLLVGLPWLENPLQGVLYLFQPAPMTLEPRWLELAALLKVAEQPLSNAARDIVKRKISEQGKVFYHDFKMAYQQGCLYSGPHADKNLMLDLSRPINEVIDQVVERILRKRYPSFERFAPGYGPIAREYWIELVGESIDGQLLSPMAGEGLQLIREAYLLPMGLLKRRQRDYVISPRIDRHELVSIVLTMLEHEPHPETIYRRLSEPVYGLVTDQVHALLCFLLIQGEIDIVKDGHSLRDQYRSLIDPRQYDRVIAAQALSSEELAVLNELSNAVDIKPPPQWTISAQRQTLERLREVAAGQRQRLQKLALKLPSTEGQLKVEVDAMAAHWKLLDRGEDVFQQWRQFLFEIDAIGAFIGRHRRFSDMPAKLDHFLSELGRYRHIHDQLQQLGDDIDGLPRFEPAPGLSNIVAFEAWLRRCENSYSDWCTHYRKLHDDWWSRQSALKIIEWRPEAISRSRHLAMSDDLARLETLAREIRQGQCHGIQRLDYQPVCNCGFDGKSAPLQEKIRAFGELKERIKTQIQQFFAQDSVRRRTGEWLQQGIEFNTQLQEYVDGHAKLPMIEEIDLFDSYLNGAEVTRAIDGNELLNVICTASWTPDRLKQALQQWAGQFDEYASIRIEKPQSEGEQQRLLEWVLRQALQSGAVLPELDEREYRYLLEIVKPEWVRPAVWKSMHAMGMNDELKARLLAWLLDGTLSCDEQTVCPEVDIVRHLEQTLTVEDCASLARLSALYYRHHALMLRVDRQRWLYQLERLALISPQPELTSMRDYLSAHSPQQWLLLDACGLPLLEMLQQNLRQWFPHWRPQRIDYVMAGTKTTTDEFYRNLLDSGQSTPFTKVDAIDQLLHQRYLPFTDFCSLASAELSIALKKSVKAFDRRKSLMISADHGFRLARDGGSYEHGGSSCLERIVPVIWLRPLDD